MKKQYFGHIPEDPDLTCLRRDQKEQAHREVVLCTAILTELLRQNGRLYTAQTRNKRTESAMEQLFGGPGGFGLLQQKMDERTDGVLARLHQDLPRLRHVDLLLFSYATAGMAEDLMAVLCHLSGPGHVAVLLCRMRDHIEQLETPRKYEYLALLGPKGCHYGEEMLYLHNL